MLQMTVDTTNSIDPLNKEVRIIVTGSNFRVGIPMTVYFAKMLSATLEAAALDIERSEESGEVYWTRVVSETSQKVL